MGAPKGNRNRARDNVYHRRVISLSGTEFDEAMKRLGCKGIIDPSNEEIMQEMKNLDLSVIRADYQWIKECEILPIEALRKIIAGGPYVANEDGSQPKPEEVSEPFRTLHPRRHSQAQVVLEARVRKENIHGQN